MQYLLLLAAFSLLGYIAYLARQRWVAKRWVSSIALTVVTVLVWPIWLWGAPVLTKANITGTTVKRFDTDGISETPGTRDVYYVYASKSGDDDLEFRNEDTWWYLKRTSGSSFSAANRLQKADRPAWITYYGWRFEWLSMYPNALSIGHNLPGFSLVRIIVYYSASIALWWGIIRYTGRMSRPSHSVATS